MTRRTLIYLVGMLALFLIGVALLWSYNSEFSKQFETASTKPRVVRLSTFLTAIDYAPYIIIKRDGRLTDELRSIGYEVQHLDPFQSAPPINESLATDRVDGVFTAEIPTIVGRAAGIDQRIVWLSATLRSEIVVPSSSSINSLADLKGKRVAVLAGTSPHFGLIENLRSIGLTRHDVEIVDMPPPEAKAAFEAGHVDAWAIWPPFVEQEIVAGKGKVLPHVVSPVQVVLTMRGPVLNADGKAVAAILNALDRAKTWLKDNPSAAQELVSNELHLPIEVVQLAWPKIDWDAKIDPDVIADIQDKANFLKELGLIKTQVNVNDQLIGTFRPQAMQ